MTQQQAPLTTGNIWRNFIFLSWPLFISYGLQSLLGLVDLKMVSGLGIEAIAAVGAANRILMNFFLFCDAIFVGAGIYISQYWGKGDQAQGKEIALNTLYGGILAGLFSAIVGGLFSHTILSAMGLNGEVLHLANTYLRVVLLTSVFFFTNHAVSTVLRATGDTRTSLLILVFINILNVPLNYCLIYGIGPFPEWGVEGAAFATSIARGAGAVVGLWVLFSGKAILSMRRDEVSRPQWEKLVKIFRLGFPSSLSDICWSLSTFLIYRIIMMSRDGLAGISAYAIAFQIEAVAFLPGIAIMNAVSIMVGQNIGSGQRERAHACVSKSLRMSLVIMGIAGVVLAIGADPIMGFFTDSDSVREIGKMYLVFQGISQIPLAIKMILQGAFHGAGNTLTPFFLAVVEFWGVRVILSWAAVHTFGLGASAIWAIMLLSNAFGALILSFLYRQGRWLRRMPALS